LGKLEDLNMFEKGFKRFNDSLVGIPDRITFIAQMHEFAMKWTKENAKKFYSDPAILVRRTIETAQDFEFDIPWLGYDVYNIEPEALGMKIIYPADSPPEAGENQPFIREKDDLKKLKFPDPYATGRMPFVLEANKRFEKITGFPPPIQFTAPFSLGVFLRGYENLIDDIYSDPDFAHTLFLSITERILAPWILTMKKDCPNATLFRGADAMASPPLVNVKILSEFVVPYIQKLKELCGDEISVLNWWGEKHLANPEEMLDLKLKISPKMIQGQDPDVEAIGPEIYKRYAVKNKAALTLGIGNLFLQKADKAAIRSRVSRYIKAGAPGGGFMIYMCYLSSETPPDNIREAIKAIKACGVY